MSDFNKIPPSDPRSFSDLMADLVRDLADLVRSETRLVKAEISQAASKMAHGAEMLLAGAIILLLAAIVLLQALVAALATWIGPAWAATLVGVVLFVIGGLLMVGGRKTLSTATLIPDRSIAQAQRDGKLVKEQMK
ncbi:phage holin family protein [Falsirhodobacter algicola]|uniref:Phage holin family protein n=1 Tax=Falsirhodobacter algicola TaxID=2692330 RepID=A0A8J8SKR2_9RHOB|nr:phage holin family protein [Falsirhodobacter algicola]QUS35639.1 phage holin family protein [Falsirhodobacter algicola]